jgi:transcriptional antiterminator NusG
VHAYSGYENFVMREILARAQHQNMQDKIGEVVVPSEEVVEMRAGQKR